MAVQHSQSAPGQFAAAIKRADPRSQLAAPRPAGAVIDHGHGEPAEAAEPAVPPADVIRQLTEQYSRYGAPKTENADG
jgi:hypothetical protein